MKLQRLRISNFQSFGREPAEIDLSNLTFLIGPNGAGKTALLQALSRLFDFSSAARRIRRSDFHVPVGKPTEAESLNLFIEADFVFTELENEGEEHPSVPPNFAHMRLDSSEGPATVRFRLDATMDSGGEIEETLNYVLERDDKGQPKTKSIVSRADRNAIQVHYLPARRDPSEHIAYTTSSLLGRLLRAGSWSTDKDSIKGFTQQISDCLGANSSVKSLNKELATTWKALHMGSFFTEPEITFVESEIDTLLRYLSVSFGPGHSEEKVDFSRLSDGQKSMLYLTIVLAVQRIGRDALSGVGTSFDIEKLKPAIFTLVAMEEPENSLSPHYLGRITKQLSDLSALDDAQALIATHSPSMLRRTPPENIRYLRLDTSRRTTVTTITMPPEKEESHKFVREAVQAFPEIYFSRLVVLGEGDSEEIVLPRVLKAKGLATDESAITVAPLGGRHVNHFWRLLSALGIPYITLLDLDSARYQGGWGRIRYVATQLRLFVPATCGITEQHMEEMPTWDSSPSPENKKLMDDWISFLEGKAIFFSAPLDLDFSMLSAFPSAFDVPSGAQPAPSDDDVKAVLGKKSVHVQQYDPNHRALFPHYHRVFKLGSKPAAHITALSTLTDDQLIANMPASLNRLIEAIKASIEQIPE